MIEFLAELVSPSFATATLTRILGFVVPIAQTFVLAVLALRFTWTGITRALPGADLRTLFAELGGQLVKATVLLWILANWSSLSALVLEEGPRLAGVIVGVASASPEELATKMISLASRFSDASVFGTLDWMVTSTIQSPAEGNVREPPSSGELATAWVSAASIVLLLIVAAAIAVMLAMPKLVLLVCLATGPFAIASFLADSQLTDEFVEGWAETTASALLALPVMAILVVFISNAPLPEPSIAAQIGSQTAVASDVLRDLANDLAVLVLIGLLMFRVFPIAAGLIQGRPPSANSIMGLIFAISLLPLRALRSAFGRQR